jgi:hypothetical protein
MQHVLLAGILIVACLVLVALFDFSSQPAGTPRLQPEAQASSNTDHWKAATPIALVQEPQAYAVFDGKKFSNKSLLLMRIRNADGRPIRFAKATGAVALAEYDRKGSVESPEPLTPINLSNGEITCFGDLMLPNGLCSEQSIWLEASSEEGCSPEGNGTVTLRDFGFEYYEYGDNATVRKSQPGQYPITFECIGICNSRTGACA